MRASLLAGLGLVLVTACGTPPQTAAPTLGGYHGTEPDYVAPRPEFVLTDTGGQPYDFRAETAGRPTLLYFGYTDCPDECPTAMAYIAQALRTTPPDLRERTAVVFVTTDPVRDPPARLRTWLDRYSADFVGLSGTLPQVEAAQRAAGVPVAVEGGPVPTLPGAPDQHVHRPGEPPHVHDRPLGAQVEHGTSILAFDTTDRGPVLYPQSVTAADLRADLPLLAGQAARP